VPAVTGSGASVRVIDRSACTCTTVVAVAVLLAAFGSVVLGSDAVAVARQAAVCAGATGTTMVVRARGAGAMDRPRCTPPGWRRCRCRRRLAVAETKLVPAGSGSVIVASCASDGPALVSVAV
jgi:hypothetical protein